MSPNFDFRFWGARGAPKGALKIEVHGTYPCMVSSKHSGTHTPTIFVPPPENQLEPWNVSDDPSSVLVSVDKYSDDTDSETRSSDADSHSNRYVWNTFFTVYNYSALDSERGVLWWGCRSVCVCLSSCVCVCPRSYLRNYIHVRSSPNILRMLSMAVARSSSGGVVIRYVFPVWWMTSVLHKLTGCSTSPPGWGSEARGNTRCRQRTLGTASCSHSLLHWLCRFQWACWIFITSCLHVMFLCI